MPRRTNQFQQLIHSIPLQLYHDAKVTESKILRASANGRERGDHLVT